METMKSLDEMIESINYSHDKDVNSFTETKQKSDCEECLKNGSCGIWEIPEHEEANGYLTSATKVFCSKRFDCSKLTDLRNKHIENLKNKSGLGNLLLKRISSFDTKTPIQRRMRMKAEEYLKKSTNEWFGAFGQSGSGKTHICASICNHYIGTGKSVLYVRYSDLLNSTANYDYRELERCKNANILFIDDLFKSHPTEYERKLIFELIDYRYINNKKTIISSELSLERMKKLDEAILGRIVERCEGYVVLVESNSIHNYRTRG